MQGKMTMPKFGKKAAKKEEDEEEAPAPRVKAASKPANDAPAKPRKLKQVPYAICNVFCSTVLRYGL